MYLFKLFLECVRGWDKNLIESVIIWLQKSKMHDANLGMDIKQESDTR